MSLKITRAFEKAGIPNMPETRKELLRDLEKVGADIDKLSSSQLGYIIKALYIAYHKGKAKCDAEYLGDCVWIGGGVQRLYSVDALKSIKEN